MAQIPRVRQRQLKRRKLSPRSRYTANSGDLHLIGYYTFVLMIIINIV